MTKKSKSLSKKNLSSLDKQKLLLRNLNKIAKQEEVLAVKDDACESENFCQFNQLSNKNNNITTNPINMKHAKNTELETLKTTKSPILNQDQLENIKDESLDLDENLETEPDHKTSDQSDETEKSFEQKYLETKKKLDQLLADMPSCAKDYYCNEDPYSQDEAINQTLYDAGLQKEQAKIIFSLAQELLSDISLQISNKYSEAFEEAKSINYFGGQENYQIAKDKMKSWALANIGEDAYQKLAQSHDGRLAIYKLMQKSMNQGLDLNDDDFETDFDLAKLRNLMKTKQYWQDKDPKVVKQVQTGFKKLYSN